MRRAMLAVAASLMLPLAAACTPTGQAGAGQRPSPTAPPATATTAGRTPTAAVSWVVQEAAPVKDEFLLYNPLYKAGKIAAVSCSLPTARLVNKQAMIRYATAFVACLEKAWEPVVTRAGFDIKPVSAVHSAPTGTDSVCGVMEQDVGAFYCGRDLGIYFNWPGYIVEGATQEDSRTAVQYLIAHEYGHHVQELTGILDEYDERWGAAGSTQQMVEQNRMEMQAHCFAAAMFGANQATLRIRGYRRDHYGHVGYNRNEAESVNFDRWLRQGFEAKGPAGCLTWAAPAAKVS